MVNPGIYRGPLSPELGAEISAAALRNAKRLIGDAEILLAAGRHATVVALAVLATEEATKAEMVRLIVSAPTPELRKEAWRAFRNHEFKQSSVMGALRRAIEARPGLMGPDDGPVDRLLADLKDIGFYVDIGAGGHGYHEPGDGPNDVLMADAAGILKLFSKIVNNSRASSVRALELWRDHVGPSMAGGESEAEAAMVAWQAAMDAEGLES